jgi:hypothetical protein
MSAELEEAFDSFRAEAFRVETLPAYDVPEEAADLEAWRAGRPRPVRDTASDPWLARIADDTAAGRTWRRLRLVSTPLTEYERWELDEYATAQGEQVRVLDRGLVDDLIDVWLFDTAAATPAGYLLRYTPGGAWIGATALAAGHARHLARQAHAAWERAEPLSDYLSRLSARAEPRSA